MPLRLTPLIVAALALGACAQQEARPRAGQQTMVPAGDPVACVSTNRIRETRVIDDQTIDFVMIDGTIFRNTLPNRCPQRGFEERFTYTTSTGQLCDLDVITVLYSDGQRGASCGLGKFVPVRLDGEGES